MTALSLPIPSKYSQLSGESQPPLLQDFKLPKPQTPHPHSRNFHSVIICQKAKKNTDAWKTARKKVLVNYDKGEHLVSTEVSGMRKDDIPKRYRLRVEGDKFQKDWSITEVVKMVLRLKHGDDIEGILNNWVGRFSRKNFPVLVREISKTGSIEHAIMVFNWMKYQKNYCARNDIYNMMIRLHARHNRIDQARGLFFEMQEWRCKPDADTYNALINAHGRAGQWRWAMNIMDDMLRAAIPPSRSTYNNLINACGSSGNWSEALKICKRMTDDGVGPDLVTHNIVLSAYKTGSQYSKALSYYELMIGTNIRPDTTTLNIVIHCLVKLGQYEKAIETFNSMRSKVTDCHADVVTFTSIMHMYSVCRQTENCKAVFNSMVAEGIKPNIVTYNTLLGSYASQGMDEEALLVFNEMKQNGFRPDIVSYTSLLNAYGKSGQPWKAREIFYVMKSNNWKPNLVAYNALIDAYGSDGMLAEAVEVLREMEREGIQPNVVSICTLLAACGRCGENAKIDTILSAVEVRGIRLNTVAYNSAIGSYMNVGKYDKATGLYRSMQKKRVKPDSVTYNILINGCCKMSMYDQAIEFFHEMNDLKVPISKEVCSSAMCAYIEQGQVAEAESMFAFMKSAGHHPDLIAYTTMIKGYSSTENWEKAVELFLEMEAHNIQPDAIACSAIMRALNRGGQPAKVLALLDYLKGRNTPMSDAIYFEVISACSMLRDWGRTVDLINTMEPSLHEVSTGLLNQLIHILGKSGKTEAMIKLLLKVVASGAEISISTYSIFLKLLLDAGNWKKYLEVLQWMEDAGVQPTISMYRDILFFAERTAGLEHAAAIRERLGSLKSKPSNLSSNGKLNSDQRSISACMDAITT